MMKNLTQEQMSELAAITPRLIGSTDRKVIDEAIVTLSLLRHRTSDDEREDKSRD